MLCCVGCCFFLADLAHPLGVGLRLRVPSSPKTSVLIVWDAGTYATVIGGKPGWLHGGSFRSLSAFATKIVFVVFYYL